MPVDATCHAGGDGDEILHWVIICIVGEDALKFAPLYRSNLLNVHQKSSKEAVRCNACLNQQDIKEFSMI